MAQPIIESLLMPLPFHSPDVAACFDAFPGAVRPGLLALRGLIFATAAETPGVGAVTECLKWGQPAYLTLKPKSGTSLRLGVPKLGGFAIYAHCQTSLIADFQQIFPQEFDFEGNRAILFRAGQDLDLEKLRLFVLRGLTYHLP